MVCEDELTKALQKLKDIEFAINESSIVAITDQRGIIQYANDKFCEMSKYSREELVGSKQSIINSGHHDRAFFKEMWRTIGRGHVWKGEIKNLAKDGAYYWVDTTIVPFLNDKGKPYQYISIRHIITKMKDYEAKIKQMAFYDPLTMLPNRNLLKEWIRIFPKKQDEVVTVLFLDIDRFKSINDNYDHSTGDHVLKEVSNRLQTVVDKNDLIVRVGGDEFIIILHGVNERDSIMSIVNKIKKRLAVPVHVNRKQIFTTASIGISTNKMENDGEDNINFIESTIKQADTAMYHAKKNGGNTHCFNTDAQNIKIDRYNELNHEIKYALEQKQFSILYHPLISLHDNKITGVEALLRWHNPKLGFVSPVEFIPVLEEVGLIVQVGKWVLKSVCRQLKSWHDEGIQINRAAVNVSPIQFRNRNFVKDIKEILQETRLDPKYLEVEITEGTLFDIQKPEQTLLELRNLGVSISIDDFGTGYSSLSYLKRLPINTLKIDKSFIDDLDDQEKVIVNTIITMGQNLKFNVVAEGIENKEQLYYLKNQKCHEGQGYYWSKPVVPDQIKRLFQEQTLLL